MLKRIKSGLLLSLLNDSELIENMDQNDKEKLDTFITEYNTNTYKKVIETKLNNLDKLTGEQIKELCIF